MHVLPAVRMEATDTNSTASGEPPPAWIAGGGVLAILYFSAEEK